MPMIIPDPPILSIIIPTKNRVKYITSSIESILSFPSDRIELVVEDNSDNSVLEKWVGESIRDSRLKYIHTTDHISMSENFDRGMSRALGEYVAFIGDDDGVNPEVVDAAIWAKENDFDALLPSVWAVYYWPDLKFKYYGNSLSGRLTLYPYTYEKSYPSPEEEMHKCLRSAGQDFHHLPKVYYGIVRRACMERVKALAGTCFPGPSPDLAGAMAVAPFIKKMIRVDYPLFVPGNSGGSIAGLGAMKKHEGSIKDQTHLPKDCEEKWSELVPRIFSGNSIMGENVVEALRAIGRNDMLRDFNVPLLHGMNCAFNPKYANIIIPSLFVALRSQRHSVVSGSAAFVWAYCCAWGQRFQSLMFRMFKSSKGGKIRSFEGAQNIKQAVETLSAYLKSEGSRFDKCI